MGRLKEHAITLANLEVKLLWFVEQILVRNRYQIESRESEVHAGFLRSGADLLVRDPHDHEVIAVEVKLYRTATVDRAVIVHAINALDTYLRSSHADRAALVVTFPIKKTRLRDLPATPSIEIWDLNKLFELTGDDEELLGFLSDFVQEAEIESIGSRFAPIDVAIISERAAQREMPGQGTTLASALESCPTGKKGAYRFEELCERAIRLLFGNDFGGWSRQKIAADGFHRFDLVARLVPRHQFWNTLAQDFRTRYIVFEFKNFRGPIGQDQVYRTEKYLYVTALRSVAIIIARRGENKSAEQARRGALREAGKLIISISNKEICELLRGWDIGEDPTNLLVLKLDQILTEIAR